MSRMLRTTVVAACIVFGWTLAHAQVPISVYPNPIQFGAVALNSQSYPLTVYISNVSANTVDITSVTVSGTNAADYVFSSAPCVGTIVSNNYCMLSMIFTPSAMGSRVASLVIAVSGVTTPVSVPLQGSGGNPIPTITTLSPANIYADSPTTTMTINGTGFLSSSVASIQSASLITTYVSSTQIKAQIPASYLTQTGTDYLTVTNPAPAGGSGSATFQVIEPIPTLNSVAPTSVIAGTAASPIVVNGYNFMAGAKVQWNGVNLPTTYINSQQLQAQPTTAQFATAGIVELSVSNPAPGGLSSPVTFNVTYPATINILDLPASALVWDPFAQVLYATVPSTYGVNGNSIAVINPTTGAITAYHYAGSEPTKLAISAISNYLYVGLNGEGSVQRLNLPAFTHDIDVSLGNPNGGGPYTAGDIKVSPSNSHAYAVAFGNGGCCSYGPLVFYTDSTKLANSVTTVPLSEIVYPSATTVYAYENGTLSQITVSSTGGVLAKEWYSFIEGTTFQFANNLIYGGDGEVFNPATGLLLGTYDVGPCCNNGTEVLPSAAINRAFALGITPFFNSLGITAYNLSQYTPLAVTNLSELNTNYGPQTSNFIQFGNNGLAFILQTGCCGNQSSQVVLVQSPTMFLTTSTTSNGVPAETSLSPAALTHGGQNFQLTINGTNFVPGSTVTFNGRSVYARYLNSTQLKAYVPAADIVTAASAPVVVKNPTPGGGTSNALTFAIQ
ncbi:MAG: choice-of-anchor D domain-containing protein [Candidatus Acidiferrales bacterium]